MELTIESILSKSPSQTQAVGISIAKRLRLGDTVALSGEMGCGKTEIIKGICKGLGYKQSVTSPSYIHVHQYKGEIEILHVDFYLDGSEESIYDLGLDEYIGGNCIVLIEWADRFPKTLPNNCWWIDIKHTYTNPEWRNITVTPTNAVN